MSGSDPNRSMVPPTKSMTRSRGRRRARARGPVHDPITEQAPTIQPVANERQARGEATEHAIEPHIPVFDKSVRDDGTSSREDFAYDQEHDLYVCLAGKALSSTGTLVNDGATLLYRASKHDGDACELKPRCCPKMPARKVPRSIHEQARDVARTSRRPMPMSGRAVNGRRSKCCSRT